MTGSAKKKANILNNEELIQKIWESVRSNNGIMVCLSVYIFNNKINRINFYKMIFIIGITAINDGKDTHH